RHLDPFSAYRHCAPLSSFLCFLLCRPPPNSTLFPYTTLFRSIEPVQERHREVQDGDVRTALAGFAQRLLPVAGLCDDRVALAEADRKSTRLNSSHRTISYAVFCWKKKTPGS